MLAHPLARSQARRRFPPAVYFSPEAAYPKSMPDQPFDLKLLPDWLKETPGKNPYADFAGEPERPRRDDDRRGPRPPQRGREGGGRKPEGRAPGGSGDRGGQRGERREGRGREERRERGGDR